MGLVIFVTIGVQMVSLLSNWFALEDSGFSIRGLSHSYLKDVMAQQCSTIELFGKIRCFCGDKCESLHVIYSQGWCCAVIILVSINLLLSEVFVVRRKIWRLEGLHLPNSFIDNDSLLVCGVVVHNFGVMYWIFLVVRIQGLSFGSGVFLAVLAYFMNLASTLYYFFKIKPIILRG